ncbi:MAG: adenine phosphoribosyltransferase [Acetobacteraceae bacterium]|nr:adenine phosphoribosyltransferase [Acetobacteraceae bacterium]
MDLKSKIRVIPDFPKPGIRFKDITTLLKDGRAWRAAVDGLAALCRGKGAQLVAAPEARGLILGSALAYALGVGFVPVRKAGKLPAETLRGEYTLEYGKDALEVHRDAVQPGQPVLVADDLLATGGTIKATIDMVEKLGGRVVGVAFLIELTYLPGRSALSGYDVVSLIRF